jgi:hypothetical protein
MPATKRSEGGKVTYEEYAARLANLRRQIIEKTEAQRRAQASDDVGENMRLAAEVSALIDALDALSEQARKASWLV